MVGPGWNAEPAPGPLVIIDASVRTARTAHALGRGTVFVQRPGSPAHELVDDFSGYYSVDFTGESFPGFVEKVLRPLAPAAVVSLSDDGALPAAVAGSLLGCAGTPVDVVRRLMAGNRDDETGGAGDRTAYTFSRAGTHRWVALVDEAAPAGHAVPGRLPAPGEHDRVGAVLREFLDAAGLEDGPARIRLRSRDGEVRVLGATPTVGTDEQAELVRRLTGHDLTRSALVHALGPADDGNDDGDGDGTVPGRAREGVTP